jgi:hypothetical protein
MLSPVGSAQPAVLAYGHSGEFICFAKHFLRDRSYQTRIHLIDNTCDGEGVAHPVLDVKNGRRD